MLEEERLLQIRDELGHRPWHELALDELAKSAGLSADDPAPPRDHARGHPGRAGGVAGARAPASGAAGAQSLASAPERLEMALRATCDVDERYLGLMEALHGQLPEIYHEPGDGEVLTRGPFVDALKRILQDGVIEGTLAVPDDLDETATLVFNATGWTYREMRSGHRWPPEKARERVVHLLVAGDAAVTATVSPAAAGRVDLRTMSRLSLGHVFVDMTQGAVPALLPTLIATRGLNLASASALVSIATIGSAVLQPLVRDLG